MLLFLIISDFRRREKVMKLKIKAAIIFTAALILTCFTNEAKAQQSCVKLDSDVMSYTSLRLESRQIPCDSLGGIYFLNDNKLVFYNTSTGESEVAYTFVSVGDSYVSGNKLYVINSFDVWIPDKYTTITVYNLNKKEVERTIKFEKTIDAIGVDYSGRIYLAESDSSESNIYLLSSEGKQLSKTTFDREIYDFCGFNKNNGIFYVEAYENMVYWGYNHDMKSLVAGKVENNKISIGKSSYTYVCQQYYYERQNQTEMSGGKYLFVDNTANSELQIYNTNSCVVDKKLKMVASFGRNNTEDGDFYKLAAVGTRAVYRNDTDTVVAFRTGNYVGEYRMSDSKEIHYVKTAHPVFSMMSYNGGIAVIEKDGDDFYYEYFSWKAATKISIKSNGTSIKRGGTLKLTASNNGELAETYEWKSSNPKIASVNQSGEVYGWNKGQVTITVTTAGGLTAKKQIRVSKEMSINDPKYSKVTMNGASTSNAGKNNYSIWSSPVNSYIMQNADGTLNRVEYLNNKVIVETYSSTGKFQKKRSIKMELPIFGGFYSGKKYNFVVFGQKNLKENNKKEVVRVVKYSKNWKRLSAVSIKGANTYIPFDAGSLRMTETGNRLYVYTCHEMYASSDGYHHQANMIFEINEQKMKVNQSYSDVMNIAQAGYVSHSFNQFIQTDGTNVYRVDHGDYYPRGISIVRSNVAGSITDVNYTIPISLSNVDGYNPTGASVGGFELSTGKCVIAGNSVDYNKTKDPYDIRNVFVSITSKGLSGTKVVWLTKYTSSSKYSVGTPQLVKIGNNQFLVMWEEYASTKTRTKMVTIDDDGNMTSKIVSTDARLSDCQPIRCKDGRVRWYAGNYGKPVLYTVNPVNLKQ